VGWSKWYEREKRDFGSRVEIAQTIESCEKTVNHERSKLESLVTPNKHGFNRPMTREPNSDSNKQSAFDQFVGIGPMSAILTFELHKPFRLVEMMSDAFYPSV
jgi:hypothetical protein